MKCINCGQSKKHLSWMNSVIGIICQECEDASRNLKELLEKGLVIEYSDGHKETIKLKEKENG